MRIRTVSLKHKIYQIEKVLSKVENSSIEEEFFYNPVIFDKKETWEGDDHPWRGALMTKNLSYPDRVKLDFIGFNTTFINFAINVKYQLEKLLFQKPLELYRINTNVQYYGMESSFHVDSEREGSWSFVYFVGPDWDTTWGGEFVVNTKPGQYTYSPYIPNTAVLFPANLEHMGHSPNRLCTIPRKSIAFTYHELPEHPSRN